MYVTGDLYQRVCYALAPEKVDNKLLRTLYKGHGGGDGESLHSWAFLSHMERQMQDSWRLMQCSLNARGMEWLPVSNFGFLLSEKTL
jgi:hypothetical protein